MLSPMVLFQPIACFEAAVKYFGLRLLVNCLSDAIAEISGNRSVDEYVFSVFTEVIYFGGQAIVEEAKLQRRYRFDKHFPTQDPEFPILP